MAILSKVAGLAFQFYPPLLLATTKPTEGVESDATAYMLAA